MFSLLPFVLWGKVLSQILYSVHSPDIPSKYDSEVKQR